MTKKEIVNLITEIVGKSNLRINEPMSLHTTFKVGGPADIFVIPSKLKILISVMTFINVNKIPFFILGNGSNLVVSDKGIRGVVVSTNGLIHSEKRGDSVVVSCGIELSKLSQYVANQGLSGLEFACGIPGSVGGAVFMNAGAYEGEISKVLKSSKVFNLETNLVKTLTLAEHNFSYRYSILQDEPYIHLNSVFKFTPSNKSTILTKMKELSISREAKQPLELPSAGSVFRRPQGYYTGKMIEECGLIGFRVGDAAISTKHCGFIVNLGTATAKDIKALIEHIQKSVWDKFGVMLQTEIKFVGEE